MEDATDGISCCWWSFQDGPWFSRDEITFRWLLRLKENCDVTLVHGHVRRFDLLVIFISSNRQINQMLDDIQWMFVALFTRQTVNWRLLGRSGLLSERETNSPRLKHKFTTFQLFGTTSSLTWFRNEQSNICFIQFNWYLPVRLLWHRKLSWTHPMQSQWGSQKFGSQTHH